MGCHQNHPTVAAAVGLIGSNDSPNDVPIPGCALFAPRRSSSSNGGGNSGSKSMMRNAKEDMMSASAYQVLASAGSGGGGGPMPMPMLGGGASAPSPTKGFSINAHAT